MRPLPTECRALFASEPSPVRVPLVVHIDAGVGRASVGGTGAVPWAVAASPPSGPDALGKPCPT